MDSRTKRIIQSVEGYLERPPKDAPRELISKLTELNEMLVSPIYSGESPGEREAREVAESSMSEDDYNKYYNSEGTQEDQKVGIES